ncbi:MAG: L-histidine N(alpha)-methyltransferase, partial [Pseudomonadales bacterium]
MDQLAGHRGAFIEKLLTRKAPFSIQDLADVQVQSIASLVGGDEGFHAYLQGIADLVCSPEGEFEALLDRYDRAPELEARQRLAARFADLDVRPIHGDFSQTLKLPGDLRFARRLGFFPGSTIGNLEPDEAKALLESFRSILSPRGRLIVGVDLLKSEATLQLAYDDPAGVTAA